MNADTSFWNDTGLPDEVVRMLAGCSIIDRPSTREVLLVGGAIGMRPCVIAKKGHPTLEGVYSRLRDLGFDLDNRQRQKVQIHIKRLRANARLWERQEQRGRAGHSWMNSWRDGPRYDF
jgi:hypothetical protein